MKRSFEKLADIEHPETNIDLHFAVEQLTPVKKGRSTFMRM